MKPDERNSSSNDIRWMIVMNEGSTTKHETILKNNLTEEDAREFLENLQKQQQ